jgi:hypothetical protein
LLNLNTEIAKLGSIEVEVSKLERLFETAFVEHSGLTLEKLDSIALQVETVRQSIKDVGDRLSGIETAISTSGIFSVGGKTINVMQFADYQKILIL